MFGHRRAEAPGPLRLSRGRDPHGSEPSDKCARGWSAGVAAESNKRYSVNCGKCSIWGPPSVCVAKSQSSTLATRRPVKARGEWPWRRSSCRHSGDWHCCPRRCRAARGARSRPASNPMSTQRHSTPCPTVRPGWGRRSRPGTCIECPFSRSSSPAETRQPPVPTPFRSASDTPRPSRGSATMRTSERHPN